MGISLKTGPRGATWAPGKRYISHLGGKGSFFAYRRRVTNSDSENLMKLFCSVVLMFALTACGGKGSNTATTAATGTTATTPPSTANEWTWVGGSKTISLSDSPAGRVQAARWTDTSGNLWLFGGAQLTGGSFNDLQEFSPASSSWTLVSGSTTTNAIGVYGTKGVPSSANVPGARSGSVSWTDGSGDFWLFGGDGYDSVGGFANYLNDLWMFNPNTKQWTWVSGSNTSSQSFYGVYGTLGVAATSNMPGARANSVSWIDSGGNLWLFGGRGYSSSGSAHPLNDLWKFNPTTKQWAWIGGSSSLSSQSGVYGTLGLASTSNAPGGRELSVSWIDSGGNLWLFGGHGSDSSGTIDELNDLWEFSPTNSTWSWMSGSSTVNAAGVYGTLGSPSSTNTPGARDRPATWTDKSGNFWLFGGENSTAGFNDLWRFNPTSKAWTWIGGSSTTGSLGNYGSKGVASSTNMPGARAASASWIDASGNLWLFGGGGYDSVGTLGALSDLWRYQP